MTCIRTMSRWAIRPTWPRAWSRWPTPGSILVTAYTHKLTDGYFEFKALGQTQIKGVEEPLNVYEVLGAGPLRTRLQVAARRGLTRFVGRQSEMEQLQQALEQAKAGHGQIVGVMGEPGLGKSRLFYEFKAATSTSGLSECWKPTRSRTAKPRRICQ